MQISVFLCPQHGELELLDFNGQIAYCDICKKQMSKIAQYEETKDGLVKNMHDGNGRKLSIKVKVFECSEHKEVELVDFHQNKAFCPNCGREMKKVGEYME